MKKVVCKIFFGSARRKKVKKFLSVVGVGIFTLTILGCWGLSAGAKDQVSVTLLIKSGPRYSGAQLASLPGFEKKYPNIKINLAVASWSEHYEKLPIELASWSGKYQGAPIDYVYIPAYAAAGYLQPLDQFIFEPKKAIGPDFEFTDGTMEIEDIPFRVRDMYIVNGKYYAFPHDSNINEMYWREDVFKENGISALTDVTWDEVLEIAQKLTQDTNGDGTIDQYGFVASFERGVLLASLFETVFWAYNGKLFDEKFNPMLNTEAGKKATRILAESLKYAPPGSLTFRTDDVAARTQTGTAVFAPACWGEGMLDKKANPYADSMGVAGTPKGLPGGKIGVMGGYGYAIFTTATEEQTKAAWLFIEYLQSKKNAEVYSKAGGQPTRLSSLKKYARFSKDLPAIADGIKVAGIRPPIPELPQMDEIISDHISLALAGAKSIEKALEDLDRDMRKMFARFGRY